MSDRPAFIGPQTEWVECYLCGRIISDFSRVEGLDISSDDEYYPRMVPICRDGNHRDPELVADGGSKGSDRERPSFDARRTGWTIEDIVEECHQWDDNPYRQTYYTTYSDVYHTNPECPHIADSERLHYAFSIHDMDGHPWGMGGNRFAHGMEECSWCENSQPEGKYLKEWYQDTDSSRRGAEGSDRRG